MNAKQGAIGTKQLWQHHRKDTGWDKSKDVAKVQITKNAISWRVTLRRRNLFDSEKSRAYNKIEMCPIWHVVY